MRTCLSIFGEVFWKNLLIYDVGYYKDLDGDEIDSLDNVSSKTGYTLIRYDDSNGHEVIDKSGNFLSKIAFDNTNTSKKEGEIRPVGQQIHMQ